MAVAAVAAATPGPAAAAPSGSLVVLSMLKAYTGTSYRWVEGCLVEREGTEVHQAEGPAPGGSVLGARDRGGGHRDVDGIRNRAHLHEPPARLSLVGDHGHGEGHREAIPDGASGGKVHEYRHHRPIEADDRARADGIVYHIRDLPGDYDRVAVVDVREVRLHLRVELAHGHAPRHRPSSQGQEGHDNDDDHDDCHNGDDHSCLLLRRWHGGGPGRRGGRRLPRLLLRGWRHRLGSHAGGRREGLLKLPRVAGGGTKASDTGLVNRRLLPAPGRTTSLLRRPLAARAGLGHILVQPEHGPAWLPEDRKPPDLRNLRLRDEDRAPVLLDLPRRRHDVVRQDVIQGPRWHSALGWREPPMRGAGGLERCIVHLRHLLHLPTEDGVEELLRPRQVVRRNFHVHDASGFLDHGYSPLRAQ